MKWAISQYELSHAQGAMNEPSNNTDYEVFPNLFRALAVTMFGHLSGPCLRSISIAQPLLCQKVELFEEGFCPSRGSLYFLKRVMWSKANRAWVRKNPVLLRFPEKKLQGSGNFGSSQADNQPGRNTKHLCRAGGCLCAGLGRALIWMYSGLNRLQGLNSLNSAVHLGPGSGSEKHLYEVAPGFFTRRFAFLPGKRPDLGKSPEPQLENHRPATGPRISTGRDSRVPRPRAKGDVDLALRRNRSVFFLKKNQG